MGKLVSNIFSSFDDEEKKEDTTTESSNKKEIEDSTIDNLEKKEEQSFNQEETQEEEIKDFEINEDLKEESSRNSELTTIKNLLAELSNQFESKIKYDKHKDEVIDKLHNENQSLKNDLHRKLILPLVNEIILTIDDYSTLFKKHSELGVESIDVAKLLRQFGDVSEDLENILYKNGIEVYNIEEEKFDPSRQKVVKTITTDDPLKDKTLCERLKKGFILNGKVIRMEHVSCFKFENTII